MAHPQQLQFVKSVSKTLSDNYNLTKIIEIGSFDVNGSIRQFFRNSTYIGVDLTPGPGVDIVCEGDKLDHPDKTYDLALSCECFEHNPNWINTFQNMLRMTKDGGAIIFTCATTGRAEHGTTRTLPKASPGTQSLNWDYYQNLTQEDFEKYFDFNELFHSYFFLKNDLSQDLYFFGFKGKQTPFFSATTNTVKNICEENQAELQSMILHRKKREKFIPKPLRVFFRKIFKEPQPQGNRSHLVEKF